MKHCNYCGKDYPDTVAVCPIDGRALLQPASLAPAEPKEAASVVEKRFWEQMDFRKFAIFLIRLQSIWLVFYAVVNATRLTGYITHILTSSFSPTDLAGTIVLKAGFFMEILRIVLHIAAALVVVQNAERIVGWLLTETTASSEQQLGGQNDFKKLAAFLIKLEGCWLGFEAVIYLTYLPDFFNNLLTSPAPGYATVRPGFYLLILRIALHIMAAVASIRYTDRIIRWLVKNYDSKETSNNIPQT